VTENASGGNDTVQDEPVDYTLGANVENLVYTGAGNFSATGNALANIIVGGAGNDTLAGGAGADTLAGGTGADHFVFSSADMGSSDEVWDFSHAQADKIDLSAIDANSGVAGDSLLLHRHGWFTHVAGQLHYSNGGSS